MSVAKRRSYLSDTLPENSMNRAVLGLPLYSEIRAEASHPVTV